MNPEQRSSIQLLSGHHSQLLLDHVPSPRAFTFLRDPYAQFISWYAYIRRSPQNPRHSEVAKLHSFEDFVTYCEDTGFYSGQTWHLGHTLSDLEIGRSQLRAPCQSEFDRAKSVLDRCEWVFLTERFHESLVYLSRELSWPAPVYRWLNKSPDTDKLKIGDGLLERIRTMQSFDLQLYAIAVERCNASLSEFPDLKESVEDFESILATWNRRNAWRFSAEDRYRYFLQRFLGRQPGWQRVPDNSAH